MPFPEAATAGRWLRLSHVLAENTPAYGGRPGLGVQRVREMTRGDPNNEVSLALSNHLGSQVDAPRHFVAGGKTVDSYSIGEWIFDRPWIVDIPADEGEVLGSERFEAALNGCSDADLLLVRTGFEARRGEESYWSAGPAFQPGIAKLLASRLPSLAAIGLDTLSLTSYRHRKVGRAAHRAFLGKGLRIFEDLALSAAPGKDGLRLVAALPLIFENADGAPCTVAGYLPPDAGGAGMT